MINAHTASIPLLQSMLKNLVACLRKGEQNAAARKIDPSVFLQARLAPDMFPLVRQVQIAADMAKGGAARLLAQEPPKFEDRETTFAELYARVDKTLAFLDSVTPQQFEGADNREIRFAIGEHKFEFTGEAYLANWVLPNFFFHVTTAYNILRHNGVDLGKRDFLGG